MAENITLDELKNDAIPAAKETETTEKPASKQIKPLGERAETGGFKAVSIDSIVKTMPKPEEQPPAEEDILGSAVYKLDAAVDRAKEDIYENLIKPVQEANAKIIAENEERIAQAEINEELDDIENGGNIKIADKRPADDLDKELEEDDTIAEDTVDTSSDNEYNLDTISDEEFEKELGLDENDDDEIDPIPEMTEEERKAQEDELTKEFNDLATPIKKSFDLSTFKIASKPISISMALKHATPAKVQAADWVLPNAGRAFSMTALGGDEIEKFNVSGGGRNILNQYKDIYSIFYEHLLDSNKPKTFEAWLKTITFADNDHLIFGAYKATYQHSNILPYTCPECTKTFMQKVNIDDMVEYPDEETKNYVNDIRNGDTTSATKYEQELFQVSDDYVFGIKSPSLYSSIIEGAVLDDRFRQKFGNTIAVLTYVDNVYLIDAANHTLAPVDYHPEPTNFARSTKKKVLSYYKILKQLNADEYQRLISKIFSYDAKEKRISYVMPACTCPKCGAVIPKATTPPIDLLFTRHRLARLSNM